MCNHLCAANFTFDSIGFIGDFAYLYTVALYIVVATRFTVTQHTAGKL